MKSSDRNLLGGCMCGRVRFQTTGEPSRVLHCHCQSCRRHTGATMATLAVFNPDQVSFIGDARQTYASAPGVERAFCGTCGSTLTWETMLSDEPICAIHIAGFDDPSALPPTGHSFYSERLPDFDVADDLPRYNGFVSGATPVSYGPLPDK